MRTTYWTLAAIAAASLIAGGAYAQTFPDHPIKLVVPFPAGGPTDTSARLVAKGLQSAIGQTVVIENQGGAGGAIAAKAVATAPADGYTLMMVAAAHTFGTQPILTKLGFDPVKTFTPIAMAVADRQVLVINPKVPAKTLAEFVAYAKANPGKLNYGTAVAIGPHFISELFIRKAGLNIVHVSYRGSAPAIRDLIGGQVQMSMSGKSVLLPHIQAGRVRAIGVTSAERWKELPDVPSLYAAGYLDDPYDTLFGVVAPMGVPKPVIAKLNKAINDGVHSPEILAALAKLGIEPKTGTPEEFAAMAAQLGPKWAEIVRITGITGQ
jgi:tripartite-type tricarboxylate transporter receptor subunit TctC